MDTPHQNGWFDLMRRGEFAAAWRESDKALSSVADDEWRRPRHLQRVWRGQALRDQRVLIRCYHGLGDTVQFVRYLPRVMRLAREVTLWIQASLMPLVRGLADGVRVLPLHDGAPDAEWDVDVELMELAHVFRSTVRTIPTKIPYLSVPGGLKRDRVRNRLQVGLAWRAGDWNHRRSVPVDLAHAVVDQLPCDVHVLQEWLWPHERMHFRPTAGNNIAETAALIDSLDLVITVDTVYAHLAGALGRPAWVLLPADADWRWMEGREDSPWYPSLRLFRQHAAGEWRPVIARARAELEQRVAEKSRLDGARVPANAFVSAARRRA